MGGGGGVWGGGGGGGGGGEKEGGEEEGGEEEGENVTEFAKLPKGVVMGVATHVEQLVPGRGGRPKRNVKGAQQWADEQRKAAKPASKKRR